MRKIIGYLLAAMLLLMLPLGFSEPAHAAVDYSTVRVQLSIGSVNMLSIPISGSYFIAQNGAGFKNGTLSVQASGGTLTVSHSSAGTLYSGSSVSIMRESIAPSAGYFRLTTSGVTRSFLGHLTLKCSGGLISAINEVPLPHYLYGVVGFEMSNTFPYEALKAQAVAAKCYVLANMTGGGGYDISDTSSDQVYKGYVSSYTNVIRAVDETYDMGLYLGSQILSSYYAASNGGATLLPSDVWGGTNRYQWDRAYARVQDPYDVANPLSVSETVFFPANGDDGSMKAALSNYLRLRPGQVGHIEPSSFVTRVLSIDNLRLVSGSTAEI
ncbi:MAG TPA: SpoIID/LytB domain-containing protein, partial [Clostridia bacterium]|nr:SpoIID/LytB domain-containing protein [Clostridia bacterium]